MYLRQQTRSGIALTRGRRCAGVSTRRGGGAARAAAYVYAKRALTPALDSVQISLGVRPGNDEVDMVDARRLINRAAACHMYKTIGRSHIGRGLDRDHATACDGEESPGGRH